MQNFEKLVSVSYVVKGQYDPKFCQAPIIHDMSADGCVRAIFHVYGQEGGYGDNDYSVYTCEYEASDVMDLDNMLRTIAIFTHNKVKLAVWQTHN